MRITPSPGTRVSAKVGGLTFCGTVVAVILPAAFEVSPAIVWDGVLSKGSTKGPRIHFDPINPDGTFGRDTPFEIIAGGSSGYR